MGVTRAGIRVLEEDGSPTVIPVREIRVSNSTLTNNSGGSVSINTAGTTALPSVISYIKRDLFLALNSASSTYTDNRDIICCATSLSTLYIEDYTSGGDQEDRTITSDWVQADGILGTAIIGSYLYVGMYDTATKENRVYRYARNDIASGGTQMTATFGTTATIARMLTDGIYLWFNNTGGGAASTNHIFSRYSISGTTLNDDETDLTCGETSADFYYCVMDGNGNIFSTAASNAVVSRWNSSGSLVSTQTKAANFVTPIYSIEGVAYTLAVDAGNTVITLKKIPLQP